MEEVWIEDTDGSLILPPTIYRPYAQRCQIILHLVNWITVK